MDAKTEDWLNLVGRTVELRREGRLVRTAEVEAVTSDASILWLRFDGAFPRELIAKTDGYSVEPLS